MFSTWRSALLCAALLAGCGDDVDVSTPDPDACKSDADCPGGSCWRFPDGALACAVPRETHPGGCEPSEITCECTHDSDCASGSGARCVSASEGYCGGIPPPQANSCRYDQCTDDKGCTDGAFGRCVAAGAFGNITNVCLYGACRFSSDCTAGPGGECRFAHLGCGIAAVLYCGYDADPCHEDTDCPSGQFCGPKDDNQGAECRDPPPIPP